MRRLFDAFDLSNWNDTSAPALAARRRVIDNSNAFLGPFLNLWIIFGVIVGIISWTSLLQAWHTPVVMIFSGVAARFAVYRGFLKTARWLFIAPLILIILCLPPFINGVRTPLLANIPTLLVLTGWMMGRRTMVLIALIFSVSLTIMWLSESTGWWRMSMPLRNPEVWFRAFILDLIFCTITMTSLIGNFQAELRRRFSLESRLSSVLKFSETVIQRSPLPMCVFGSSGKCIEANKAYAELFEISREAVLGKPFHDLPLAGAANDYVEALEGRASRQCELRAWTNAGKEIWLDLRFLPFEIDEQSNLLVQCIDLTERKRLSAELEALAFNDSLTGLANRRLFFDRLDQALARCRRNGSWGTVLLLDLDRFKELNDSYGHEAGDKLLVEIANRLRSNVRATDTVARLGGDEFVILLEEIGENGAEADARAIEVAEMLGRRLSEAYDLEGAKFLGSASIGSASFDGAAEEDAASILRRADSSMYAAKKKSDI